MASFQFFKERKEFPILYNNCRDATILIDVIILEYVAKIRRTENSCDLQWTPSLLPSFLPSYAIISCKSKTKDGMAPTRGFLFATDYMFRQITHGTKDVMQRTIWWQHAMQVFITITAKCPIQWPNKRATMA